MFNNPITLTLATVTASQLVFLRGRAFLLAFQRIRISLSEKFTVLLFLCTSCLVDLIDCGRQDGSWNKKYAGNQRNRKRKKEKEKIKGGSVLDNAQSEMSLPA